MAEEKKCPRCKEPMTPVIRVGKDGKETVEWMCLKPLCIWERKREEQQRRRAA